MSGFWGSESGTGGGGVVTDISATPPLQSTGGTTPDIRISASGQQKGTILIYNGSAWVSLSPGVPGQFLQTEGVGANPQWGDVVVTSSGLYNCPASVNVFDVVYLSNSDEVDQADADGMATQPVIGFVISKPTTTSAVVQYSGELTGFSGLTDAETYYLSTTPGSITDVAPSASGNIVQKVGFAKNSTTIVIMVDRDIVQL